MSKNKGSVNRRPLTDREASQYDFETERLNNRARKPRQFNEQRQSDNYIQDSLPIKGLITSQTGTVAIETEDGRFVKIVEVTPINFNLIDPEAQRRIIGNFMGTLQAPGLDNFQIKVVSKRSDVDTFIDTVNQKLRNEKDPRVRSFGNNYATLLKQLSVEQSISKRFFIIFEYTQPNIVSSVTEKEALKQLDILKGYIINFLERASLLAVEFTSPDDEMAFYYEVFYFLFNRRSSLFEPLENRVEKVLRSQEVGLINSGFTEEDTRPQIPLLDIVSPRGIDHRNDDYTIMDGMYYSYIYMKGSDADGFPDYVNAAWLGEFSDFGDGVDVDIFIRTHKREEVNSLLPKRLALLEVGYKGRPERRSSKQVWGRYLQSALYLKESFAGSRSQRLHDVSVMLTVIAPTHQELIERRNEIIVHLDSAGYKPTLRRGNQREAFLSTLPINYIDKFIYNKSKRNMLTSAIATGFPFTAYEISDEGGIVLGQNIDNGSLCAINIFNARIYRNPNGVIIGGSGSGKTFSMQIIALRLRLSMIQIMILAPLKGEEFKRAAEAIGGAFIKISPSSPHTINILELKIPKVSDSDLIDNSYGDHSEGLLSSKVASLTTLLSLLMPESYKGDTMRSMWLDAVNNTYLRKGITNDLESMYNSDGSIKEMPILSDLNEELVKMESQGKHNSREIRSLMSALSPYIDGAYKIFNGQTNVDMENMYTVIDISGMPKDTLPIAMFIALDFYWDIIKQDRTKEKLVIIDEVWQLIGAGSTDIAANYVLEMYKTIRGFGGAVWSATQDIGDFFSFEDGKYGKGIISNARIKAIFSLETEELDYVSELIGLTASERDKVLTFDRGQCILVANNNKIPIEVKPSSKEYNLITTDREDLKGQVSVMKERTEQEKAASNHFSNVDIDDEDYIRNVLDYDEIS